jgi:hypothetical protein
MSTPTLPRHRVRARHGAPAPATPADAQPSDAAPSDAQRAAALEAEVEQLRAAMASRAAIEQAKGVLMLLTSCTDDAAFALLVHISGHTHRKVRDVALAITASATGAAPLPSDVQAILRDACPPGGRKH